MKDVVFNECREIAFLLNEGKEVPAREKLIRLLDYLWSNKIDKDALVNHLIRATGLFPYLESENADWRDALVADLFRVDVGEAKPVVLHREQSRVLKTLLEGKSVVVNAPTSFGKSFVIDALISIKKPTNVIIIVPTIALTDETRRRLFKKFSEEYQIISTADAELGKKNILVFPQERALNYCNRITNLDLLIIDEFYKADSKYDSERAGSLISVLARLKHRAKQSYFLMPNIDELNDNLFTKGMVQIPTEFKTVVLDRHPLYKNIREGSSAKKKALSGLVKELQHTKSLVYASTPGEVGRVAGYIRDSLPVCLSSSLMQEFSEWVGKNYGMGWGFVEDIRHGVVRHNGAFHRSLAQLCVRVFDKCDDCHYLVATSSLIEGVNTSAQNVILWSNKKGRSVDLDPFSFKNIMGRSGRMFRYFVGHIYELAKPPEILTQDTLDLRIDTEDLYAYVDEEKQHYLTEDQIKAIKSQKIELYNEFGKDFFQRVFREDSLKVLDLGKVRELYKYFCTHRDGGVYSLLQSDNVQDWRTPINLILFIIHPDRKNPYQIAQRKKMAEYISVASRLHWRCPLSDILNGLAERGVSIDDYFKLERDTSFKVASCIKDIGVIMQACGILSDLSRAIARLSNAFMPARVYDLEEYGLPRMLSQKIHAAGVLDLESPMTLAECIKKFQSIGRDGLLRGVSTFDGFDQRIVGNFYDGITCSQVG